MEFCPECSSMMYLDEESEKFECGNCDAVKLKDGDYITTEEGGRDDLTILDEKEGKNLPKTDQNCPECENTRAYWYLQQTRAADESETRFYICTKCNKKWRDYD